MNGDFNIDDTIKKLKEPGKDELLDFLKTPTEMVMDPSSEESEFTIPDDAESNNEPAASSLTSDMKESPEEYDLDGDEFAPTSMDPNAAGTGTSGKFKWSTKSKALTEIIDQIQEPVNDWLYSISVFSAQEHADLKRIIRMQKESRSGITDVLTDYEQILIDKASEMEDYRRELPFSPDERKDLTEAFAELLKDTDTNMSPGTMFFMTLLFIFIPRWLPILPPAVGKILTKYGLKTDTKDIKREVSWSEQNIS